MNLEVVETTALNVERSNSTNSNLHVTVFMLWGCVTHASLAHYIRIVEVVGIESGMLHQTSVARLRFFFSAIYAIIPLVDRQADRQ